MAASPLLRGFGALTDDLLEDILLRMPSPADLARASVSCASFRRVVANPAFLRRYRTAHPPLLLGFVSDRFHPAKRPHPNALSARALLVPAATAAGFTFNYLPGGGRWDPRDVRDGRVLLERRPMGTNHRVSYPDLAVCDPLTRRCLLLPPIPDDLVASIQAQIHEVELMIFFFQPLLVPCGDEEEEEEGTSFQVIVRTLRAGKLVICMFSSASGLWGVGTSINVHDYGFYAPVGFHLICPHYDHGCFYWRIIGMNKLLKLEINRNRMELNIVNLPPGLSERDYLIMDAEEGRLYVFGTAGRRLFVSYYTITQNGGKVASERQELNVVPLPCPCKPDGASAGYIFLVEKGHPREAAYFSLEIKTLKIERVSSITPGHGHGHVNPYFGYPPFMSPRRI